MMGVTAKLRVQKKLGTIQDYSTDKVFQVVLNALNDSDTVEAQEFNDSTVSLANEIVDDINDEVLSLDTDTVSSEMMQNIIYEQLIDHNEIIAARQYMLYSSKKVQKIDDNANLIEAISKVFNKDPNTLHENGNKDSRLLPTQRDLVVSQIFRELGLKMYPEEVQEAHKEGLIHLHDLDMSPLLPYTNCCNVNISDMLKNGFKLGETKIDTPHSIGVATALTALVIQDVSINQYGGTSVPNIDLALAPYAKETFDKHLEEAKKYDISNKEEYAWDLTKKDIYQAMQGLEYNINCLHGTGAQVPFVTLSAGLGTDKFSTEIQRAMLNVRIKGMDGKSAIFPKLVFTLDKGINMFPDDPNYSIKKLVLKCQSMRDYPDIVFGKNIKEITGGSYMTSMGCVRGSSLISYKYKGKNYTTSFEKMYEQFEENEKVQQNGIDKYVDLDGVTIKDSHTRKIEYVKCLRIIKNNTKHGWLRISANRGKMLECTTDHPLQVVGKGRVLAKDLKVGDRLIKAKEIENIKSSSFVNKDELNKAWLLGDIICDGCLNSPSETLISYAFEGEEEIRNKIGECYPSSSLRDKEQHRGKKGNYREVAIKDSELHSYCVNAFKGIQKEKRVIPDFIFNSSYEIKLAFLAGMVDADGYINQKSQKIQLGSTNKALATGQYILMNQLGLNALIYANHFSKVHHEKIRYRVESKIPEEFKNYLQCTKKCKKIVKKSHNNASKDTLKVTKIEQFNSDEPCYDVTTDSDFFDVDGLVSHNCRSFLPAWKNSDGEYQISGRLNMGVVTVNPVQCALSSNNIDEFWDKFKKVVDTAHEALKVRIDRIRQVKPQESPIIWQQGAIARLKDDEDVTPVLKNKRCTVSLGYIGLYETAAKFFGGNWEHNKEAYKFVTDIVEYMHDECQKWYKEEGYYYSLYSTPSENLTGRFSRIDKEKFGSVKDITDKEYYNNSFHYDVRKPVTPFEKMKFEAPFQHVATGGFISYNELPDVRNNLDALEKVIDYSYDIGIGYLGTNIPMDSCLSCGFTGKCLETESGFKCPSCGETKNLQIVERLCGYLGSLNERQISKGRMNEIEHRVFHSINENQKLGVHVIPKI